MQLTKQLWESRDGGRIVDVEGSEGGVLLGWECLGQEVGQVDGASDVGNTKLVQSKRMSICQWLSTSWLVLSQMPTHTHTRCHTRWSWGFGGIRGCIGW